MLFSPAIPQASGRATAAKTPVGGNAADPWDAKKIFVAGPAVAGR
jgi:hypothetical protein